MEDRFGDTLLVRLHARKSELGEKHREGSTTRSQLNSAIAHHCGLRYIAIADLNQETLVQRKDRFLFLGSGVNPCGVVCERVEATIANKPAEEVCKVRSPLPWKDNAPACRGAFGIVVRLNYLTGS